MLRTLVLPLQASWPARLRRQYSSLWRLLGEVSRRPRPLFGALFRGTPPGEAWCRESWLGGQPRRPRLLFEVLLLAVRAEDGWGRPPTRPAPPGRPQFDEQALIASAQQGELPAFNQLVLHYQSTAYNVAYRILGDPDMAADATQDGFLKAYRKLGQYRGGSFKAWLLRIITNTCYDLLRAHKRRPTSSLETEDSDPEHDSKLVDAAERPDDHALRQELAAAIQAAIGQLPMDQRTVLVLSDVEGMNYQEIADATGAALGTVKSRLSRARARVREILLTQKELLPSQYRLTDS